MWIKDIKGIKVNLKVSTQTRITAIHTCPSQKLWGFVNPVSPGEEDRWRGQFVYHHASNIQLLVTPVHPETAAVVAKISRAQVTNPEIFQHFQKYFDPISLLPEAEMILSSVMTVHTVNSARLGNGNIVL